MTGKQSMQHTNDHIDDLFRRAADNYPLNTEGADWNKVLTGLVNDSGDHGVRPLKNKKYRRLLWLILFLPFTWICNEYKGGKLTSANQLPRVKQHKSASLQTANTGQEPGHGTKHQQNTTAHVSVPLTSTIHFNINPQVVINGAKSIQKQSMTLKKDSDRFNTEMLSFQNKEGISKPANQLTPRQMTIEPNNDQQSDQQSITEKDSTPKTIIRQLPAQDTLAAKTTGAKKKTSVKTKRFYAGFMAGADVSLVKFQQTKNVGLNAGVVAGYNISKRFALEAGFFTAKKNYYSKGTYFDKKQAMITTNYKIETVDGKCNMFDVSLNGQYKFISRSIDNWYVAAGISSYLMKKEDYDYTYKHLGQIVERHIAYKNSINNFLSIANMSIGYSRIVYKTWQLRVETYAKLPLRGVGIGNLPLMSTGMNAGFTKLIF